MRATLQSLGGSTGPNKESGPKASGMQPQDRINVATFHNHEVARGYQRELTQAGVMSTFEIAAGKIARILVDYEDRGKAAEILAEHAAKCPDRRPRGIRREFDYLILGGVLGFSVGTIFVAGAWGNPLAITAPVPFAGIGALCGHFIDRLRMHYRHTGKISFGVWEFLVLVPIPALMAFLWHLIPLLIKR